MNVDGTGWGEGLHFASVVGLGIISYFLKRSVSELDSIKTEVAQLKTKVAILLDRDRQRRLADYEQAES